MFVMPFRPTKESAEKCRGWPNKGSESPVTVRNRGLSDQTKCREMPRAAQRRHSKWGYWRQKTSFKKPGQKKISSGAVSHESSCGSNTPDPDSQRVDLDKGVAQDGGQHRRRLHLYRQCSRARCQYSTLVTTTVMRGVVDVLLELKEKLKNLTPFSDGSEWWCPWIFFHDAVHRPDE
jgi:hypothetical protein